jgi:hypothetical protein
MKYLIVCCCLLFVTNTNAQKIFQYKFAAAVSKMQLDQKTREEVIAVFQKKLSDYKYKNVKCIYDSVTNLFLIQSETSIESEFLASVLIRYSKTGFGIYELYNQKEIFECLAQKDLKKEYVKKNLLFIDISTTMLNSESPFLSFIKLSDTAKLVKDILNFKSRLPSDIIFSLGKIKDIPKDYIEVFGLKNNSSKIMGKELIDSAKITYDARGYVSITIKFNEVGKIKLAYLTKKNINKAIAFVINNTVLMSPRVVGEISEGSLEISGGFNYSEATEFLSILKEENLPIKLKFVKSETIKK